MATITRTPRTHTFTPPAGLTGPFHIAFRLFEDDALTVYDGGVPVEHRVIATYSDGYTDTARVVLAVPTTGAQVRIDGNMKPARDDDYVPTDPNLVQNLNIELGRIWAVLAELKRDTRRSARSFTETAPFDIAPGHVVIQGLSGFEEGPDGDAIAGAETAANRAEAAAAAIEAGLPAFQNLDTLKAYPQPFGIGTTVETLREGFAYEAVPTASHVQTAAPAHLRVLNRSGIYSIKAFGAKGDGVADDSAAVQAAVNEGELRRLVFDKGTYPFHEVLVDAPIEIAAVTGSGQNTVNASGTMSSSVQFLYNGPGGTGSRMLIFKARDTTEIPPRKQWLKGGGITGRPHINGAKLCEVLIDAQSTHGCDFDVELSRATYAGMSLNAANGLLSQFNRVRMKYVYGGDALTEASHGLVMNGNNPAGGFLGCTQNYIWTDGIVHDGDMVRMVGHCDNNHMWLHGTAGLINRGNGRTLSINQGNDGIAARVNHIHYACGRIYLQTGSFGNHFDFVTSEGASITGGGQYSVGTLIDYINGKAFTSQKAPLSERRFISAADMLATGSAVKEVATGTGVPIIRLPKASTGGAAFSLHDLKWGAGTIVGLEWVYRVPAAGTGNAILQATISNSAITYGLGAPTVLTDPVAVSGATIQNQLRVTALSLPENGVVGAHVQRLVGNAGDTLTQDLHLIGVNVMIDFNGPASFEARASPWKETV